LCSMPAHQRAAVKGTAAGVVLCASASTRALAWGRRCCVLSAEAAEQGGAVLAAPGAAEGGVQGTLAQRQGAHPGAAGRAEESVRAVRVLGRWLGWCNARVGLRGGRALLRAAQSNRLRCSHKCRQGALALGRGPGMRQAWVVVVRPEQPRLEVEEEPSMGEGPRGVWGPTVR
jgi:hypothetical protein